MIGSFIRALTLSCICLGVCAGCQYTTSYPSGGREASWHETLDQRLPLYGHRNWIVIVDSAYPAQTRNGIETVVTGASQTDVLTTVLNALAHSKHVKPIVYTDAELNYVPESDAPGVTAYRAQLKSILGARAVSSLPHEQIIKKLDEAGQTFKVLVLKTNMTIPYTSVFLQLDCAYWNADAESRLRKAMEK
jgi:L-fucose mutarotase/ribose pyranase (RbsD/FucU family)